MVQKIQQRTDSQAAVASTVARTCKVRLLPKKKETRRTSDWVHPKCGLSWKLMEYFRGQRRNVGRHLHSLGVPSKYQNFALQALLREFTLAPARGEFTLAPTRPSTIQQDFPCHTAARHANPSRSTYRVGYGWQVTERATRARHTILTGLAEGLAPIRLPTKGSNRGSDVFNFSVFWLWLITLAARGRLDLRHHARSVATHSTAPHRPASPRLHFNTRFSTARKNLPIVLLSGGKHIWR